MDMSHDHGGMSMGGTTGGFQMVNKGLAETYWYLIVGFVGALVLIRVVNYVDLRTRYAQSIASSHRQAREELKDTDWLGCLDASG